MKKKYDFCVQSRAYVCRARKKSYIRKSKDNTLLLLHDIGSYFTDGAFYFKTTQCSGGKFASCICDKKCVYIYIYIHKNVKN